MGLKSFFKKVGSGLKAGYNWVKDKAIPAIGRIAKPALNIISMLPGKVGVIGKVGNGVVNTIENVANQIPNANIRDKIKDGAANINNALNKVGDAANRFNNARGAIEKGIAETKPYMKLNGNVATTSNGIYSKPGVMPM